MCCAVCLGWRRIQTTSLLGKEPNCRSPWSGIFCLVKYSADGISIFVMDISFEGKINLTARANRHTDLSMEQAQRNQYTVDGVNRHVTETPIRKTYISCGSQWSRQNPLSTALRVAAYVVVRSERRST
jgi:hypothetical protein